eukprot:941563_1
MASKAWTQMINYFGYDPNAIDDTICNGTACDNVALPNLYTSSHCVLECRQANMDCSCTINDTDVQVYAAFSILFLLLFLFFTIRLCFKLRFSLDFVHNMRIVWTMITLFVFALFYFWIFSFILWINAITYFTQSPMKLYAIMLHLSLLVSLCTYYNIHVRSRSVTDSPGTLLLLLFVIPMFGIVVPHIITAYFSSSRLITTFSFIGLCIALIQFGSCVMRMKKLHCSSIIFVFLAASLFVGIFGVDVAITRSSTEIKSHNLENVRVIQLVFELFMLLWMISIVLYCIWNRIHVEEKQEYDTSQPIAPVDEDDVPTLSLKPSLKSPPQLSPPLFSMQKSRSIGATEDIAPMLPDDEDKPPISQSQSVEYDQPLSMKIPKTAFHSSSASVDSFNFQGPSKQRQSIGDLLSELELSPHIANFKAQGFETAADVIGLDHKELKELGVNKMRDRNKIRRHSVMLRQDVSAYLVSKSSQIRNALVICVGIANYDQFDALDTAHDLRMYRSLFEDQYNYKVIVNDPSQPMNKEAMERFLLNARNVLYDFNDFKLNHDALIVTFGGHGTSDSVMCSDGSKYKHKAIRQIFFIPELKDIPKIFLVDACRTDCVSNDEIQKARGCKVASAFSTTVMASDGNEVYGAPICKFVTFELRMKYLMKEYRNFGNVIKAATANIKKFTRNEQTLVVCEHDFDIERVMFLPKERSRGTKRKRYDADCKNISVVKPVLKFLKRIGMEYYYYEFEQYLSNHVVTLKDLDEQTLIEMGIKAASHRKKIIKAINKL